MRRTFAGLIFGIAFVCASIAISGWLLQRTAFDPDRTGDLADVVLQDDRIKTQIVNTIADAAAVATRTRQGDARARPLPRSPATPQGAAFLSKVMHDAHARLIGEQKGPVHITGDADGAVGAQRGRRRHPIDHAAGAPGLGARHHPRILRWTIPFTALFAVGFFVIGFMLHPHRSALLHSLGYGMLLLALLIVVLGYVVPRFALPALSDNMWADVPARLANDSLPLLVGLAIVLTRWRTDAAGRDTAC